MNKGETMSGSERSSEQIERIQEYERKLDEARALLDSGQIDEKLTKLVSELEAYYTSSLWKRDFADDESGLLPEDLKRGVLSEDGIYDLLTVFQECCQECCNEEKAVNTGSGSLETERLILRPWLESDAEECFKYAKDPRVGPICGWQVHTGVENSRQVIRDVLAAPETYAIVLKETGLPIGSIGLHFHSDLAEGDDEAEVGYWLGVPYWGRGIVPEAARELLRHAFEDLNLGRVWCGYYDGNEQSKRVQDKLGFKYQWTTEDAPVPQMGETRRGHVNFLTKEDWEAKR